MIESIEAVQQPQIGVKTLEIEVTEHLKAKFWPKVKQGAPDECWEWTGQLTPGGYGKLTVNCRRHKAHRLSYLLHKGKIDALLQVHHSCDNPRCVNPNHLSQGDQFKNMKDAMDRDRIAFGIRNAATSRTTEQVREICRRALAGESRAGIASEFGTDKRYVGRIAIGEYRERETRDLRC